MTVASSPQQSAELPQDQRFQFGENWRRFLVHLNDDRIDQAVAALQKVLCRERLDGLTFLDIGSGSGLHSLAARRLGARVRSFDYDSNSVACTEELRRRYHPDDPDWVVSSGSALDGEFLESLGQFDVVYSWGVLHHTGNMWLALQNAAKCVKPGGLLMISIYNDQGYISRRWHAVKKAYVTWPRPFRTGLLVACTVVLWWRQWVHDIIRLRLDFPTWHNYGKERGMTAWIDVVDWVGGYPFEVASPHAIFDFFHGKGFELRYLTTVGGGLGCNEFTFQWTLCSPAAGNPQAGQLAGPLAAHG